MKRSELQERIQRLNESGSKDWQSLSRQAIESTEILKYNIPQMRVAQWLRSQKRNEDPLYLALEWGRGTGKTTILADYIYEVIHSMPRSRGQWISPTYVKILTEILPSFKQGMALKGYHEGLHYFIGRKPPASWKWDTPYQAPTDYSKVIYFWNGTIIQLVSQDVTGGGRAMNNDFEIADEAALLSAEKMSENTSPTMRGSKAVIFRRSPYFLSRFYCSSTPLTQMGMWFLDLEHLAVDNPERRLFLSASCRWNMNNLPKSYLSDAEKTAIPFIFKAEYKNIRPKQIKDGFYPLLDESTHGYNQFNYDFYTKVGQGSSCLGDADLNINQPLILGIDWGAAINSMVVCQNSPGELRALNNFFALSDDQKIQDDMFQEFIDYYEPHQAKSVYLWYDNTGNVKTGITKRTRAEQAADQLRAAGWSPTLMTSGKANPPHEEKYILWNNILKEENPILPRFKMNRSNCKELWISMFHAKAARGRSGEIKKDKGSEKSKKIQKQHATHLSDAMDSPIYGMYYDLYKNGGRLLPELG